MTMAVTEFTVIIVGGGPVGLTAALALHSAGIRFLLLERREEVVVDVGASIVIGAGSLRVFHQLGLTDKLRPIGGHLINRKLFTKDGYKFREADSFRYSKLNHGASGTAFHRAQLVQVLFEAISAQSKNSILTGKSVVDIHSDKSGVKVTCADGSSYEGSIVLGADGVHSKTRRLMRQLALKDDSKKEWDPESPFMATYRCLWCSFPRPTEPRMATETQNKDRSAMYVAGVERGWIFLYEKLPQPTNERTDYTEKDINAMAERFANFSITETLKVKDVFAQRLTSGMGNMEEGIAEQWSWGRIVLAGDACHKYMPNVGLGFQSGLQDVTALSNKLHTAKLQAPGGMIDDAELTKVFTSYRESRIVSVKAGFDISAKVARLQAWANPIYYFFSRWIMVFNLTDYFQFNVLSSRAIRKELVLDYIATNEPYEGRVKWDNPIPSPAQVKAKVDSLTSAAV